MTTTNTFTTSSPIVAAVGPQDVVKRYAASEAQIEVWLSSSQSVEANCAYNEIASLTFAGQLDVQRLQQSIEKVVHRHGSLRSTFSEDGLQVLEHRAVNYGFEFVDFSDKSAEELELLTQEVVLKQASTPFDLVRGPLLRFVLQKLDDSNYKLTFAAHHLILDGWSLSVFCKDLGHFYAEPDGDDQGKSTLADDYEQYSQQLDSYLISDAGKADESFWVSQFVDEIPALDLPTENKRPPLRTYFGHRYDHQLSSELVERVRKVGAKSGCSLFNIMLAAFNAWVARISGNDDFCVGIPTAGQAAMDMPELIGHCVNTMPLRTKVDVDGPFVDYMKSCRGTLLDSLDHQRYSYGTLLRKLAPPRDPSRPPMLAISFNIDPVVDASELGFHKLKAELSIEPRKFENFEWFINGVIQKDKSIELQIQFNTDLYSAQAMKGLFEGFEAFLEQVADDPQATIADLHVMSIPQRQKVLVEWNATEQDYPTESTLHEEFHRQAEETPDQIAVTFENTSLSYREVEQRSNQVARVLREQGIGAGDLVGICVNRSAEMLVYLYGIMKSGAGYVPLDPAYPSDRLRYMCDHSGLKLVVTESELGSRVADFGKPQLAIDEVDFRNGEISSEPVENNATPYDVCYVIYTSGSTGKPKGVQVPHGSVVNFLYAMQQTPGFDKTDSVLAVTTLSFDIAVLELYLPTISGGQVVIVDSVTAADGAKLAERLEADDISLLQATPATWRMMIEAGWNGKRDLKVLCGGEPMPQDLVAPLLDRCGELWNMYGPTETTVWSAAYRITEPDRPILIGKPIGNTQIYILDSKGNEVPVGSEGEIYIGGAGVTLGYLNQSEMTDQRFIRNRYRNPFVDYVSDRLYKTGDLAKFRLDGNIEFLRRNDKQVKVRGFRIELGEIEQILKSNHSVANCVVLVREAAAGDARLVAYVVLHSGETSNAGQLRDHVRQSLPYYMVPQHFVFLESLPQTNNGKIDHKALPAPIGNGSEDASEEELPLPVTAAEKFVAKVWEQTLEIDDVRTNDTFFDIGGHSLLVMKVIAAVEDKTGVKLGPQEFLISTLAQMAEKIAAAHTFADDENQSINDDSTEKAKAEPEQTDPETSDAVQSESKGAFRLLKGFWN
ncbi:non-ribosomal peptide synthetase [Mariniblastus fucicola]|uniref:Polyketide synthase PksJ n=1 Tax=Mariniblastus fucicola TaxID=980251 RepID=A0A5B9PB43_9BACT|nr:non-ribosomal peptide synthetase [Mariniblastus fucicola]QEG22142.1 Polyketide synthase PksJ [Mariniblastus fucicola]